ncbi:MAG TPA: undecaprenyl diphosphate synthase family protein, partial [Candidatus Nanoarchaeia archaeon]|nr:undecaprenyl diphosphate synthase family protein [Candidatus Nanoarchaeia archaeon]
MITHLAIIMDGNRRWAINNKLETFQGHHKGAETLDNIINFCLKEKIKILTIYALSSKNLENRSKEELAVHF